VELLHCKDDADRGRLIDLSRRMRWVEARGSVLFLVAAAVGAPTFGAAAALPPLPGLVAFWVVQRRIAYYRRPEQVLFLVWLAVQGGVAGGLVLAHGPSPYLLPLLIPLSLLAALVFPGRIAALAVGYTVLLQLAVGLVAEHAAVEHQPFLLLYPLAVAIAGSWIAAVASSLDLATRGVATVDPLTGLPNRLALQARVAELEHQAAVANRPVTVIVCDPDRFKQINDTYGHPVGDRVLAEVAERIRVSLPTEAAVYRLGGEEFVILAAETGEAEGCAIAAAVAEAVSERPCAEVAVTLSLGVAASLPPTPFRFNDLFAQADRALYAVKGQGGNGVCLCRANGSLRLFSKGELAPLPGCRGQATRDQSRRRDHAQGRAGEGFEVWEDRHQAATGSWLIRDDLQRRQLLALNKALRERAWPAFLIGFAVGIASAVEYGWQILLPPAVFASIYIAVEHLLERLRRPELALGAAWLGLQGSLMASGLVADRQMVFAGPLLFLLPIGSSAVFPPKAVAIGISFTLLSIVLSGLIEDPSLVGHAPAILLFDCATVATIGMLGVALGRSTIEHRDQAVVDQLTGLFNRAALQARVAELAHRAAQTGEPVAVLIADIDRFKAINDNHGHAVGDAVLKELGKRLRANLRAFESAYRFGGEEFVVLLAGATLVEAEAVATRLCRAVSREPLAGLPVTVSVGMASSKAGEPFDYDQVFARADLALYQAKRAGGNRAWAARTAASGEAGSEGVAVAPIGPRLAAT